MIDAKKQVVAALQNTGLKVHYEHFVNSQTAVPCITYTEYDKSALMDGDTLGYSTIIFHVKVWGKDIKTLTEYAEQVDNIMRRVGFKRRNCFDLWLDGIGQRQLKYEAKALENY